jgi:hypothetical protein
MRSHLFSNVVLVWAGTLANIHFQRCSVRELLVLEPTVYTCPLLSMPYFHRAYCLLPPSAHDKTAAAWLDLFE